MVAPYQDWELIPAAPRSAGPIIVWVPSDDAMDVVSWVPALECWLSFSKGAQLRPTHWTRVPSISSGVWRGMESARLDGSPALVWLPDHPDERARLAISRWCETYSHPRWDCGFDPVPHLPKGANPRLWAELPPPPSTGITP